MVTDYLKSNVIIIENLEKADVADDEHNYCFDERSKTLEFIGNAGFVVGAGGAIVACAVSGPPGWIIGTSLILAGGAAEIVSMEDEWSGSWPSREVKA